MSATITTSIPAVAILTAIRSYLLSILPEPIEIVRGQVNRVPTPATPDYIVMTPLLRERIMTNIDTFFEAEPAPVTSTAMMATKQMVQIDIHGPNAEDNSQIVATLWRDDNACQALFASGYDITPLYASEARNVPFIDAEANYEQRFTLDLYLEVNPVLTLPQQYMDTARVVPESIDVEFPPD